MLLRLGVSDNIQIAALIAVICLGAFVLQNFEGWHAKNTLSKIEPDIVYGSVTNISLLPSNTNTTYVVTIALKEDIQITQIASADRAIECKIGQTVALHRRGLDYRWANKGCDAENPRK